MTSEDYIDLVGKIHALVTTEILQYTYTTKDPVTVYPKLVIMYEFFRLLRGESFTDLRPSVGEYQKRLYEMEDEIREALEKVKEKIDFNDERVQYNIDQVLKPYLKQ